jgi:hypothetical protein
MTGDFREKYLDINVSWTNKAGKMAQVLATQKRLVEKLARGKNTAEMEALLISVSEGYDVANDLIEWMRVFLTDVGEDAKALAEGSTVRNQLSWNQQFLSEMMDARQNRIDKVLDEIREKYGFTRKNTEAA